MSVFLRIVDNNTRGKLDTVYYHKDGFSIFMERAPFDHVKLTFSEAESLARFILSSLAAEKAEKEN